MRCVGEHRGPFPLLRCEDSRYENGGLIQKRRRHGLLLENDFSGSDGLGCRHLQEGLYPESFVGREDILLTWNQ